MASGRASNKQYGGTREKQIVELIRDYVKGQDIEMSPGSFSPVDGYVYKITTNTNKIYAVQCKASRAATEGENKITNKGLTKLIKLADRNGYIPLVAESKGTFVHVWYARNRHTMFTDKLY